MTHHFFGHHFAKLSYYKFGNGPKTMLCFHGFGMHGRQFTTLDKNLGHIYTFYGFDLFFHEQSELTDPSLSHIKRGIKKADFANLIADFCEQQNLEGVAILSYSLGTQYAASLIEEIPNRIVIFIACAPSFLNPGKAISFFSRTHVGNKMLEKLMLSKTALLSILKGCLLLKAIDQQAYDILYKEIATAKLRFNIFACFVGLRHLSLSQQKFISAVNNNNIQTIFIFGERDFLFPVKIGVKVLPKLKNVQSFTLDESHDMINERFAEKLSVILK